MAAPDPYAGDAARVFTSTHWKEWAANYSPAGPAMFARRSAEANVLGLVDHERLDTAARFFLGYNNVNNSSGVYTLQRTPPAAHPLFPRLVCHSVAAEAFKLEPFGEPGGLTIKAAAEDPADVSSAATQLNGRTSYRHAKLTAQFRPVPYRILADADVAAGGEWQRWTSVDQEMTNEVLSLSGFQLVFFEGTGLAAPLSSPKDGPGGKGHAFSADVGQVIVKSDVVYRWMDVPQSWIMYPGSLFPAKIVAGLGRVNKYNWPPTGGGDSNFAGTLLLVGAKLTRHVWGLAAGTEDEFTYDVEFHMSRFDPPKGWTDNPAVPLNRLAANQEPTDERGHNCMPWRGDFTDADENAGMWFGATFTGGGADADRRLYEKYDFRKLFDHPLNVDPPAP